MTRSSQPSEGGRDGPHGRRASGGLARPRKLALPGSKGSAGFTLIEVMVSAVVLGIGLVGLVNLHASAIRGLMRDEMLAVASDVARQRLEEMTTLRPEEVPACAGAVGCRTPDKTDYLAPLSPVDGFECTRQVEGADVPRVSGAAEAPRYRVDMVVEPHPDALRQPDGQLITVSVCWQDYAGIQELRLRRFVVGGD